MRDEKRQLACPIVSQIIKSFEHHFADVVAHADALGITVVEHDERALGG